MHVPDAVVALVPIVAVTYWTVARYWYLKWGSTEEEVRAPMAGDELVQTPTYQTTLTVDIAASAEAIWPWLMQMGHGRGGLYSYDWLDRVFGYLDGPSARTIHPEWQGLKVGDVIPIGRGQPFPVRVVVPFKALAMGGDEEHFQWSWQFELHPINQRQTRLISRNRACMPATLRTVVFMWALEPAAFLMTRKMLLGIKSRAESSTSNRRPYWRRTVCATPAERERVLPGDELIPDSLRTITHAITIVAARRDIWPWLVQMGADRAGWYSYDLLDNGGRRSATDILPAFQNISIATLFPALPGRADGFVVLALEADWYLVLGWRAPTGELLVTWTFALEELPYGDTRLMVRVRAGKGYSFHGLPAWLGLPAVRVVHFFMQRKQLMSLAARVERRKTAREGPTRRAAA